MKKDTNLKKASMLETFKSFLSDCASICKEQAIATGCGTLQLVNTDDAHVDRTITALYGTCTRRIFSLIATLEKSLQSRGRLVSKCIDSSTREITRVFIIQPNIYVKIVTFPKDVTRRLYVVAIEMEALAHVSLTASQQRLLSELISTLNTSTNGVESQQR